MHVDPFNPAPAPEDAPIVWRELSVGSSGRKAYIVDHLVDPAALPILQTHFESLPFRFSDTDRTETERFRHLVHTFDEEDFDCDPGVATLRHRAADFLREVGLPFGALERIYANFNLFGDFQFTHDDGDVWTALVFLNAQWNDDWGGELLLYEDGPQPIALAVPPKPGRMVVFDGRIQHRGGVPSKFCTGARLTLAIKFFKK